MYFFGAKNIRDLLGVNGLAIDWCDEYGLMDALGSYEYHGI